MTAKEHASPLDWNAFDLPLPADTRQRLARVRRRPADGDNVGLWLDKLVYRDKRDWSLKEDRRAFALEQLCGKRRSAAGAEALVRLRESVRAVHDDRLRRFGGRIAGRLLVDYGRANAVETTASFHHAWGVPRIPGSALKGLTRAAMEVSDEPAARVAELFGELSRAGRLTFYDALPADGVFALALDVLTPHHREYYAGDEPPADWQSPVPHTFLDVVDTEFEFCVALERRRGRESGARDAGSDGDDEHVLADAASKLRTALEDFGVGAKTSAGYGRFSHWSDA